MKSQLIGKDPDAGKDRGQEKWASGDEKLDGITDSVDMSLSKLQEIVEAEKPGMLQSMGSQSQTRLSNSSSSKDLKQVR